MACQKKISELSGGRYYDLPQIGALVKDLEGMGRPRQTPIDDRQDDHVEHIAAEDIADGQVKGTAAHGRKRGHDFGKGGGQRDQGCAHECSPQAGLFGQAVG